MQAGPACLHIYYIVCIAYVMLNLSKTSCVKETILHVILHEPHFACDEFKKQFVCNVY